MASGLDESSVQRLGAQSKPRLVYLTSKVLRGFDPSLVSLQAGFRQTWSFKASDVAVAATAAGWSYDRLSPRIWGVTKVILPPRFINKNNHIYLFFLPRGQPGGFIGEADVFDTWFTSSMTPQINSHWNIDADKHAKLFPMDLRPQSHEIIRTWTFYTVAKVFPAISFSLLANINNCK